MRPKETRKVKQNSKSNKAFWNNLLRKWHWISGAVCLVGTLLFAVTGITLNHASQMEAKVIVTEKTGRLTPSSIKELNDAASHQSNLSQSVIREILGVTGESVSGRAVEWTDVDAYISLPRPGGDAWLSIDRQSGDVMFEKTNRGVVAYLNDLHKGRNTGLGWSWFIDIFAVICIVFCLTGLWLLYVHSKKRKSTWPLAFAGLLLPALVAIFFNHG